MANCIIEEQNLHDIANAIRTKNGTMATYKPSQMAGGIMTLESAESVNPNNPVIIYDYDGTIIKSYTKANFLALTEYPTAPTHEDVIFDEYNWSLADAKTYLATHDELYIGAIYKTENNATILYVDVSEDMPVNVSLWMNGSVTVMWDDNTSTNLTGNSNIQTASKSGLSAGIHKIKIINSGTADTVTISGNNTGGSAILEPASNVNGSTKKQQCRLNKIVIGNIGISNYGFKYCYNLSSVIITNSCYFPYNANYGFQGTYNLKHINLPKSCVSIPSQTINTSSCSIICTPSTLESVQSSAFNQSRLLKICLPNGCLPYTDSFSGANFLEYIEMPDNIVNATSSVFANCYSLKKIKLPTMTTYGNGFSNYLSGCRALTSVTIPDQYTDIPAYMFQNCYSLTYLKLPKNITSINGNSFAMSNLFVLDCSELLQVPTLSTNLLALENDYKIVVPDSLYESWIVASYWSDVSTHIVKASEF